MKKKLKRFNKYLKKLIKIINTFIKNILKSCEKFSKDMKKLTFLFALAAIAASCGSTKVSVNRPLNGTSTTITVTTNNPISTQVNPNVELQNNAKKQ